MQFESRMATASCFTENIMFAFQTQLFSFFALRKPLPAYAGEIYSPMKLRFLFPPPPAAASRLFQDQRYTAQNGFKAVDLCPA